MNEWKGLSLPYGSSDVKRLAKAFPAMRWRGWKAHGGRIRLSFNQSITPRGPRLSQLRSGAWRVLGKRISD